METLLQFAEAASTAKAPNLWGALGCALAYSGALFATIDSFADMLLARGDRPDGRMSPALKLKSGSKLSAAGITVVSAGTVLALDSNWFAFGALTVVFLVLAGIGALVLVRHRDASADPVARHAAPPHPPLSPPQPSSSPLPPPPPVQSQSPLIGG